MTPHHESFRPPAIWRLCGVALLAVVLAAAAWFAFGLAGEVRTVVLLVCAVPGLLLLAVALLPLLSRIRSSYSPDGIVLRYLPFVTVRLARDEVARIERVDADLATYGGFGLRRLSGGGFAMLFDAGPVLRITATDGKGYVVRSAAPEQAVAAIGVPAA
ncbi:hypothetical protein [Arenivirga flava]|uniref:Uncharacterized protein n=1 Tax=Arenivirga flava TaxID=1930060 RepID=A0AA37XCB7_9MICO|nr:hypothetical protein [Arenivirga flava]GMA29565.1 hypothetical protein GCM10025874_28180 [Arenivirga flava]